MNKLGKATGLEKVQARLAKKSASVQAFLRSDVGREVIRVLEDEFYNGELMADTPEKTAYNLGRRDVVMYLKQLQRWDTIDYV